MSKLSDWQNKEENKTKKSTGVCIVLTKKSIALTW